MSPNSQKPANPTPQLRCPHCHEPIVAGQERCFACGEKIRVRHFGSKLPVDYRIFIAAGVIIIVALIGILTQVTAGKKTKRALPPVTKPRPQLKVKPQDSLPRPKKITQKTAKPQTGNIEFTRALDQLQRIKARYEKVKYQVLGEKPTPRQNELMNQIQSGITTMSSKISQLSGSLTPERKKEVMKEISELERKLNNLTSELARAPKKP